MVYSVWIEWGKITTAYKILEGKFIRKQPFSKTDERFQNAIKKTSSEMGYEDERWISVYGSCNLAGCDVNSAEPKFNR
jgi:hypothetical protein